MMKSAYFQNPRGYRIQKTLKRAICFEGKGLHCGKPARLTLQPAGPNHGILFERTDLEGCPRIFASSKAFIATDMATTLGYGGNNQIRVATVEHLLSALFAMGITNVAVSIEGEEVPILDGSAGPYVESILEAGIQPQPFSHPVLRVLKPIRVHQDGAVCELLPRNRLRLTTSIDFRHPSIGVQTFALDVTPQSFAQQIGKARTFGFVQDVEKLRSKNLAQGASLDNVLGFSENAVLNPEGMRFTDECVRHKLLDALGDLALCGCWIEGELVSFRGGHSIHLTLLQTLQHMRSHWELVPSEPLRSISVADTYQAAALEM
ncbi:MAG: UDP-3-O-[3-hydroxymyristoyl] N-acetylglucosamine deacetylase [Deltaproteobacteria bacterium]|nr:UDP-3-O-[3-hydroxymyristoyl] N-acetylglucosamine deacetylase [Deltaproteobacteria bacterium]